MPDVSSSSNQKAAMTNPNLAGEAHSLVKWQPQIIEKLVQNSLTPTVPPITGNISVQNRANNMKKTEM